MSDTVRPEWIRPADVKALFGISRAKAYELIAEGKIKSVSLRQRGQAQGSRLISYDSLNDYINGHAEEGGSNW